MNAFSTTARDMAAALLGKRRIEQDVRVIVRTSGDMGMRYVVLVTPAGSEQGEYYEIYTRRALDELREGRFTPEELELSIAEGVE